MLSNNIITKAKELNKPNVENDIIIYKALSFFSLHSSDSIVNIRLMPNNINTKHNLPIIIPSIIL